MGVLIKAIEGHSGRTEEQPINEQLPFSLAADKLLQQTEKQEILQYCKRIKGQA